MTYLQNELNIMKMYKYERISDFAERLKNKYQDLIDTIKLGQINEQSMIISKTTETQALNIFMVGINLSSS